MYIVYVWGYDRTYVLVFLLYCNILLWSNAVCIFGACAALVSSWTNRQPKLSEIERHVHSRSPWETESQQERRWNRLVTGKPCPEIDACIHEQLQLGNGSGVVHRPKSTCTCYSLPQHRIIIKKKKSYSHPPTHPHPHSHMHTPQVIGATLRDSISNDVSLCVVSQALDAVFDLFGDDLCPPSLFVSLSLLPVLTQTNSTLKARVSEVKINSIHMYRAWNNGRTSDIFHA